MNEVAGKIAREIHASGSISFARFMQLALYCPVYGYYEKEEDITGRRGDFFTSVSVGPLFGELLASQFAHWLEEVKTGGAGGARRPLHWVEAGAHDGSLANDILKWLREWRPALFSRLEYWIVEPSPRRQASQRNALRDFAGRVRWAEDPTALPPVEGVFFCNELLDAMPVCRFGWDARRQSWFEWRVALAGDGFAWVRGADVPDPPATEFQSILPDGFILETSPAARDWWLAAARALVRGKLLALDYGFAAEELLVPERQGGTLRAYRAHQAGRDVLARPGEQDLTAHVNFPAIQSAGEAAGLTTTFFDTQERFLTRVAARTWSQPDRFGEWPRERIRQFQTLTHPQHLGRVFKVLVQER
jgi:SAM-dependent MidA family methyltransferase